MKGTTSTRTKIGTVLVSTLHDPQGRMAPFLEETVPFLTQLYQHLVVIATVETAAGTVSGLRLGGIRVDSDGGAHIGDNRRQLGETGPAGA